MSKILAIDPGTYKSAFVLYSNGEIEESGIYQNDDMLAIIYKFSYDHFAVEMIASYGMPVGKSVFETCVWIGRFIQRFKETPRVSRPKFHYVYRKAVKMHLCGSTRAKDSNIRQAIIDRYPATGGGKTPQIGIKNKKGPLYGISKDVWAALAVAITFDETYVK